MWTIPQKTANLLRYTNKCLNRKLHFLCSRFYLTLTQKANKFRPGAYSETSQTSKIELFPKTNNSSPPFTIFAKSDKIDTYGKKVEIAENVFLNYVPMMTLNCFSKFLL